MHYCRFGNGNHWLFCFHGYGEEGNSFHFLEEWLRNDYTLIALDFPFHGSSSWNEGLLFTAKDLLSILNSIMQGSGQPSQPINLLGYSMGGRVALHLLQTVPDNIGQVILVAPDGLHHNIWHWLSTQTFLGNKLFAFSMFHPGGLFAAIKLAYKTGFFNKSIFNFVHYYLDHKESRILLYKRWTTMRKFNPRLKLLKKIIHQKEMKVNILFGKYDRIIITRRGIDFQKGLEDYINITELEAGHQLLKEKYAHSIAAMFRS